MTSRATPPVRTLGSTPLDSTPIPSPPRPTPPLPSPPGLRTAFAALARPQFRYYVIGLLITSTGGWVQRIAQDWLVLALTDSPTAVGITTMCQFLPTIVLGLGGGVIADRFPKRAVLTVTMTAMGLLAAVLGVLTVTGHIQVWHVNAVAVLLGVAIAVDNPTRQAFVAELAPADQLRSAVSMVSSTFQLGAMLGPAASGLLISGVGSGYAFMVNAVSYIGALVALSRIGPSSAPVRDRATRDLVPAVRFVWDTLSVRWPVALVGVVGMFTLSLGVTMASFAKSVFHSGSAGYGLLSSALALGSMVGAVLSARSGSAPRLRRLVGSAAALAVAEVLCAVAPTAVTFVPLLVVLGAAALSFITTAQSMVQLSTPSGLRGRVLAIYLLVFFGSGAIGGPVIGAVVGAHGPRVGLVLAGACSALAALALAAHLARTGHLRLRLEFPARPAQMVSIIGPR
ncbi:MAG: MFS transporter [Actinomycetota bacterium]|nr:MFS transporter [Actinomycetota bacterium]